MDDHPRSESPLFEPGDGEFSFDSTSIFPDTGAFDGPVEGAYMYPVTTECATSSVKVEDNLKRKREFVQLKELKSVLTTNRCGH